MTPAKLKLLEHQTRQCTEFAKHFSHLIDGCCYFDSIAPNGRGCRIAWFKHSEGYASEKIGVKLSLVYEKLKEKEST